VARQWMRHRSFSYNEVSARYTEVPCQYYTPPVWRLQDEKNRQGSTDRLGEHDSHSATLLYRESVETAIQSYVKLMESGVARELARMVLPQSMYTTFVFSCDYRNLLNFLKLRMDSHAQWEIQRYATAIMHLLMPIVPTSMGMVFDAQEIEQKTNVAEVNDLELSRKMSWTLVNDDRGLGFIGSAPLLGAYMIHFALQTPHPLELVAFIENRSGTVVARATGKSHFDALANLMRKRLTEGGRRYSDFLGYSDALITEVFGE
jgi:thymidylate synthase ThyX